jgi:hypothetical protein
MRRFTFLQICASLIYCLASAADPETKAGAHDFTVRVMCYWPLRDRADGDMSPAVPAFDEPVALNSFADTITIQDFFIATVGQKLGTQGLPFLVAFDVYRKTSGSPALRFRTTDPKPFLHLLEEGDRLVFHPVL